MLARVRYKRNLKELSYSIVKMILCQLQKRPILYQVHFSYAGVNDFSLLANEVLTIPSTAAVSTAVCRDITVPGDMMVEDNETFTIAVETSNSNDVIMGPSTATVTIVDNDGK